MLYLFHGTDEITTGKKAHSLMDSLLKRKPDASLFELTDETFATNEGKGKLEELIGGQGLFSNKYIVFLNKLLKNVDAKEAVMEKIKEIAKSENIFVMLEGKLNKTELGKIEKLAEKIQEFSKKENEFDEKDSEKQTFFATTDAFGRRDRKQLWALFTNAIRNGMAVEEFHGAIFWQVKSMLLASKSKSAVEAGMSPFPFSKAKGFLKNFKEGELEKISSDLVAMYHDAHRGVDDFETMMEKFILSL